MNERREHSNDLRGDLLFKRVVILEEAVERTVDVLIREGKIVQIDSSIEALEEMNVIDGEGRYLLPGVIDVHVHLRVPGAEHKEDWNTGSAAAAAGGVTTVLDMPNNTPSVTSRDLLESKRSMIAGRSRVNYGFYMGGSIEAERGSSLNVHEIGESGGRTEGESQTNVDEYVASDAVALKVYMGSSTGNLLVDREEALRDIFQKAGAAGRLVCVHAESELLMQAHLDALKAEGEAWKTDPTVHPQVRDDEVAYRAVQRALNLAREFGTRLHVCHASTRRELALIAEAKASWGADQISCEVTPHHLFLGASELARQGNYAKMNPPLRTAVDQEALMDGIRSGVVDMVATDHAPHTPEEKERSYADAPSGIPGLETSLPLLLDAVHQGALGLADVVRVTAAGPAQRFGLTGKGWIEVGADADVVLVDMEASRTVENGGPGARYSKCGWSAFSGRTLKGWPVMTLVGGQVVMQEGEVFDRFVGREIRGV